MSDRPRLSDLTPAELRQRALDYRDMAATATAREQHGALIRLAERYEELARERQAGAPATLSHLPGEIPANPLHDRTS